MRCLPGGRSETRASESEQSIVIPEFLPAETAGYSSAPGASAKIDPAGRQQPLPTCKRPEGEQLDNHFEVWPENRERGARTAAEVNGEVLLADHCVGTGYRSHLLHISKETLVLRGTLAEQNHAAAGIAPRPPVEVAVVPADRFGQ